ncbi:hypothetical protein PG911_08790 [Tenacibaculum ovolyticum]|uniref:hypothetical protein n=1 Tax=Tenacibaculum ovolyticum TaxID=104270 RepID=UPI0022F3D3CC|nr:hypothetical protein [Tenacibaculum ovolyticum]WBX78342.1 hypothetical protein PG911_08790 [Tenacibaculum ovolyticum]
MTVELNGKKYLPIDVLLNIKNQSKIRKLCSLYECIPQGIVDFKRGSIFRNPFAIVTVLVPEKYVNEFSKENL